MEERNPVVFISYSWDSKEHQDRVLQLSNKLRSEGIDCVLDQYEDSPPEGWPKWMERNVEDSDFVLIVCTELYFQRTKGTVEKGLGIKWESTIIYQHLYNTGANNTKFIPIYFNDGKFDHIPVPLQSATFYNVDDPESYEKLYRRLRRVKPEKPVLGNLRKLPEKERKTLFVSDLIDQEKWDKANWLNGVTYFHTPNLPPILSILFKDLDLGIEIFNDLIDKIGQDDDTERLRVSIVEGELPNQGYGYFVVIGENLESTKNLISELPEANEIQYIAIKQRIHRMKPNADSENLSNFKNDVAKHGCYYIAPADQFEDPERGRGHNLGIDYKILKRKIEFRKYEDIPEKGDPDSILKSQGTINHFL